MGNQLARTAVSDRASAKRRTIMDAATTVFLRDGYHGASLEEITALAAVSKPTIYRYFADKQRLFDAIIRDTMDRVNASFQADALTLDTEADAYQRLCGLGRRVLTALLDPEVLRLRRLVIGESGRFPDLGCAYWYGGFEKGLATLAAGLEQLAQAGQVRVTDFRVAAGHFAGLILWVPVHRAMLCGTEKMAEADLADHVDGGVRAFLAAYGTNVATAE